MKELLIIGAGGHGKVVADTARIAKRWEKIVFLDDEYPQLDKIASWDVVGRIKNLSDHNPESTDVCIAMGSNKKRMVLINECKNKGYSVPEIIHSSATVADDVFIGEGTVVFAGSVINIGARVGVGNIINTSSVVEHDCRTGDGVHLSPGVNLAGNVAVGDYTWVGIGASVINNISIGENVIIGAGAVVVCDIEKNIVAYGVPAKKIKYIT